MTNYLFRNTETGEIRQGISSSLNSAARLCGIEIPYRGKMPAPWVPWECWGPPDHCVWHYTETGECVLGPRK